MFRIGLIVFALFAVGCGMPAAVRPVPKGSLQAEVGLGGPVARINRALTIPMPLTTVGARYGLGDRWDVSAHLHPTALGFGVLGLDVGSTWLLREQEGAVPTLAATGRVYGFAELTRGRPTGYLELTPVASWRVGERFEPYLATTALVQFAGGAPTLALAAGTEVSLGSFGAQLELRWYAPYAESRFMVVNWSSVGGLGGWGVVLGLRYRGGLR